MTDHKESPSKETDRLSRAWPEGVLPTRGEQLAGLIVLDQCGLVSRERWHRWAETQAVVDRALGAAEPFTAGMDGDFHAWRVRRCEAVGVAVTATSEEGEGQVLTFRVDKKAGKDDIRKAVEEIFNVKVSTVRTVNYEGKLKRRGRTEGRRPSWKKAYVTLKKGEPVVDYAEAI